MYTAISGVEAEPRRTAERREGRKAVVEADRHFE